MIKFFVISLLFSTGIVCAAEIKVLDSTGMIRAVREVDGLAKVSIVARGVANTQVDVPLTISNLDGLASDLEAYPQFESQAKGRYVFGSVRSGTWKIQTPAQIEIVDVKVLD